MDYKALGENTIVIDCDVLQADGGTRTAAVTGGYVALADAVAGCRAGKRTKGDPLLTSVAAVSVGIVDGEPRLDLCYEEDVAAETDMNVVCTASGDFVEIQGTAEREPFSRDLLGQLLDLAVAGCAELTSPAERGPWTAGVPWLTDVRPGHQERGQAARAGPDPGAPRSAAARWPGSTRFPARPKWPKTGATFEENALLKARAIAAYTGLPAVADDSGLCVDALNGMPGVLSARWAGQHGDDQANLDLVLAQVADVPDERLGARFVCAAALAVPGAATGCASGW